MTDVTKLAHLWTASGLSLCDLVRYRISTKTFEDRPGPEPLVPESAPACGSCLLVVTILRRDAAVLLAEGREVFPRGRPEASAALEPTRWVDRISLDSSFVADLSKNYWKHEVERGISSYDVNGGVALLASQRRAIEELYEGKVEEGDELTHRHVIEPQSPPAQWRAHQSGHPGAAPADSTRADAGE